MNYAILSPIGVQTEPIMMGIIGGNWLRAPNGNVYVSGWWVDGFEIPDSETHVNLTVEQALAVLSESTTVKSFAISGIDDPVEFMNYCGFVRCNEDGSDL